MCRILTFGEIIYDVYPDSAVIGGAGLNFAAHCQRCGGQSLFISAVGKDARGEEALAEIRSLGLSTDLIKQNDHPTGRCDVTLGSGGVPTYSIAKDSAYDFLTLSDEELSRIGEEGCSALCFGTLIQRNDISSQALRRLVRLGGFAHVVCDVNLREGCFDKRSAAFCLESATVLKVSSEEEPKLREMGLYFAKSTDPCEISRAICLQYPNIKYLLYTMGEQGAFVYSVAGGFFLPAKKTSVASTVGAGDSFTAAFICSLLKGASVREAAELAVELSSFVVSRIEAIPDYTVVDGRIVF